MRGAPSDVPPNVSMSEFRIADLDGAIVWFLAIFIKSQKSSVLRTLSLMFPDKVLQSFSGVWEVVFVLGCFWSVLRGVLGCGFSGGWGKKALPLATFIFGSWSGGVGG